MSVNISLVALVSAAVDVAWRAARVIRSVQAGGNLSTKWKGHNDPQTVADLRAQHVIVRGLKRLWPDLLIVGEEDVAEVERAVETLGEEPDVVEVPRTNLLDAKLQGRRVEHVSLSDLVVWVDPLDATKEFTEGRLEAVTTLVGISARGRVAAGVIVQPFVEAAQGEFDDETSHGFIPRTGWGIVGVGAFGISLREEPPPGRRRLVVTRSHFSPAVDRAIRLLHSTDLLQIGGVGHKILALLEGRADCYIHPAPGTKKWDTCAPEALVRAGGGMMTNALGWDIDYTPDDTNNNLDGILAARSNDEYDAFLKDLRTPTADP